MGQPYSVEVGFPVNGVAEIVPFSDQEVGSSPAMNNLIPFDQTGRMRGGSRPGLARYNDNQVNGAFGVQCVSATSATYVNPVLGDATAFTAGNTANATYGFGLFGSAAGAETAVDPTSPGNLITLGAVFGPAGNCYVVSYAVTTTDVYMTKYSAAGVIDPTFGGGAPVKILVDSAPVDPKNLLGLTIDEDTVYVWYRTINEVGEGIMRIHQSNGTNRDSTTKGVWIRAEIDATHTERVFGGVDNAGWDVLGNAGGGSTSHPCMKAFGGKLAVVSAPLKSGGAAEEHECVLYVIDTKTGIVDAVHDLGVDGTATSENKGMALDLEFALDGFVYVLFKDATYTESVPASAEYDTIADDGISYLRKVSIVGVGVWEIETVVGTDRLNSVCWNNDRRLLAVCGDNVLGTSASLVLLDPDSKGLVDYALSGVLSLVRCDGDGNYWIWKDSNGAVEKYTSAFVLAWSKISDIADQRGACLNAFFNPGTDEQGSSRIQRVVAIANGDLFIVAEGPTGPTTIPTDVGSPAFSASAPTIYATTFGILTFFADGKHLRYYDPSVGNGTLYDWQAKTKYGRLPQDPAGGFGGIETWDRRLVIYGLSSDPSNWYTSAAGDPFDWKLQPQVANAAISGRLSPAGLFPEKLVAVVPFDRDICLFMGDHSIYQLSKDPAVDGQFDKVSDVVGVAPGRAWCLDGLGSVYFLGNSGGLYKIGLNGPPKRISNRNIDKRLSRIDFAHSRVTLSYDINRQGIWILVRHDLDAATEHYFFSFLTEGLFPVTFASASFNPMSVVTFDQDDPGDQKILIGGADGYVRQFDDDAFTDDVTTTGTAGTPFSRYFVVGPWLPREGVASNVMVRAIAMTCGADAVLKATLQGAVDAQAVIEDPASLHSWAVQPKRRSVERPRVSAAAMSLRVDCEFNSAAQFEGARLEMQDVQRII